MPKSFINRIFKTKLAAKIWLYMILSILIVLLFIDISLSTYFRIYNTKSSIKEAGSETSYVASCFSETYIDLIKRFVHKTSSSDFKTDFIHMIQCDQPEYTNLNNSLQNLFLDYTQMNNLIESVLLIKKSSKTSPSLMFYSYNCRLKNAKPAYDIGFDLSQISGISVLPCSASPFSNQPEVIPIVIPLKYSASDKMVLIAENAKKADLIMYLFLSTTEVKKFLELYINDDSRGILYLVNSAGQNMSLPSSYASAAAANNKELSSALKTAVVHNKNYIQSGNNHVYIAQIWNLDLYLVNIIPNEMIASKSNNIHIVLYWVALISVFIITCLSFMISIFVTKPLKKLMESVHNIKSNTYTVKADINAKDEIGQLNESIDSMYHTIQRQILAIKQDEEENYNTKMQLLSEQINPHFIYNALEFINMEVYNNHTANASDMISSLGNYLRISLAYGENQHLIEQELELVKAYVSIMNYRFNNRIQVNTKIQEKLLNRKILKCILQPLVENSIKHGFNVGINNGFPILPTIDISLILDDNHLTIMISDNGAGIDVDKANKIMLNKQTDNSSEKHLGLNNIYQRLNTFYGKAVITFESIPFFENKVTIMLPAHFFNDNG